MCMGVSTTCVSMDHVCDQCTYRAQKALNSPKTEITEGCGQSTLQKVVCDGN